MEETRSSAVFRVDGRLFDARKAMDMNREICPNIPFPSNASPVTRRNERERNRVRLVNEGFTCLRQKIPFVHGKKRLSKVETLRYAVDYIKLLQCVIREHDERLSGDVTNGRGEKTEESHGLILSDVNEAFSGNIIRNQGRKAMLRLLSTRAQERWKKLTENGRRLQTAHAQRRQPIRRESARGEQTG